MSLKKLSLSSPLYSALFLAGILISAGRARVGEMTGILWTSVTGRGVSSGQTLVNAHPLVHFILLPVSSLQQESRCARVNALLIWLAFPVLKNEMSDVDECRWNRMNRRTFGNVDENRKRSLRGCESINLDLRKSYTKGDYLFTKGKKEKKILMMGSLGLKLSLEKLLSKETAKHAKSVNFVLLSIVFDSATHPFMPELYKRWGRIPSRGSVCVGEWFKGEM